MRYKKLFSISSMMLFSLFDIMACFTSAIETPELELCPPEGAGTPTLAPTQDQTPALTPQQIWIKVLSGPHGDLTTQQYRDAAICLVCDAETRSISINLNTLPLAVHAFDKYYEGALLSQAQTPLDRNDHIFNHYAIIAYYYLTENEKITYGPRFLDVMRWVLEHDTNPALQAVLMSMDSFLFLKQSQDADKASQIFVTHPAASCLYENYPLLSATAYLLQDQLEMAQPLYASTLATRPLKYELSSLINASLAFYEGGQTDLLLETTNRIMNPEAYGYTHTKQDLTPQDYLRAIGCYMMVEDYKHAFECLTFYFSLEENEIDPDAYRYMANYHTHLDNYAEACEYWQISIDRKILKHPSDYLNASSAFNQIQEYERAAQLLRYAIKHFQIPDNGHLLMQSCHLLMRTKDYKNALAIARQYMALRPSITPKERPHDDLLSISAAYRLNYLYEESAALWDMAIQGNERTPAACLDAADDHFKSGNFHKASNAFLRLTPKEFEKICKEKPQYLKIALIAHLGAKRDKEAQKIIRKYAAQLTTPQKGLKSSLAAQTTQTPSTPRKGRIRASQSSQTPQMQTLVNNVKIAHVQQLIGAINETTRTIIQDKSTALEPLREEISKLVERSKELQSILEGRVPVSVDMSAPSSASSSSAASSSASDAARLALPRDPLIELQRLKTHISVLADDFKRQKDALSQAEAKEIRKRWIESSLASPSMIWEPPLTTGPLKRKKVGKGKTQTASTSASSSASTHFIAPSSTSGAASSSTVPSHTPHIEWRITPSAKKEWQDLKSVRGFQDKFAAFRHEIEMEPWGRRGHTDIHASGRAKRLKGHDNVFSRRFAKGERFFYHVELTDTGQVIVTILGLMKHDL